MGSADIVPGVSGGTMALIVGIYDRLIHAISSFDLTFITLFFTLRWKRAFRQAHWKFMVILLTGILCAFLFFTKVVPLQVYMFTDPELIFGIFFGLIVGSIFILVKAIDNFSWSHALFVAGGILVGLWVVTRVPADTPESPLFIFLSGSIAICAMVLPGISGSYILLILRKYDFILSQLGRLGSPQTLDALWVLVPFILGALAGLMLFTRLLAWLLDTWHARTLAVLIGFLIGSLYVIWPYQDRTYETFVSERQVVAYDAPLASQLRAAGGEGDRNRPEFHRLGEELSTEGGRKVEVQTVKQKLVHSEPYVPYWGKAGAGTPHFWSGLTGIFLGLIAVVGLDYMRNKS